MPVDMNLSINDIKELVTVCNALSSVDKVRVMQALTKRSYNLYELSKLLNITYSSVVRHVNDLEKAQLIFTKQTISIKKSVMRSCSIRASSVFINMFNAFKSEEEKIIEIDCPVGSYFNFAISSPCELVSEDGCIGKVDEVKSFYHRDRGKAQLIAVSEGWFDYKIINEGYGLGKLKGIEISFEVCSEAPNSNPDWPTDITVWINGKEIGTATILSDYGGRRGQFTPLWWPIYDTQYGELKNFSVRDDGSYINGRKVSAISCDKLKVDENEMIDLRIGIKDDANFKGGFNIFGEKFGDFKQNIKIKLLY